MGIVFLHSPNKSADAKLVFARAKPDSCTATHHSQLGWSFDTGSLKNIWHCLLGVLFVLLVNHGLCGTRQAASPACGSKTR